jgi:putative copper export protein
MDIASVEFFSSASIKAFTDHPHVLDGALGRTLAYLGLSIVLGLRLWMGILRDAGPNRILAYQITAFIAGLAGAFLVINAALSEAIDPFSSSFSMQEAMPSFADYQQMLLHTAYGNAWLLYLGLLTAAMLLVRHAWPAWIMGIGAGFALAACGHSGEYGLGASLYWFGALHLLLALTWVGGFCVLLSGRLGEGWRIEYAALHDFSRIALPLFLLIILLGLIRLGLQYDYEDGLGALYVAMLIIKLVAVGGVIAGAASLRKLLRSGADENAYDNKLGTEIFFAGLLVLATALLTQLPPK